MKRFSMFFIMLATLISFAGCKTDDVGDFSIDTSKYFEIPDHNFALYLMYAMDDNFTGSNAVSNLPAGIVFEYEGKYFLNIQKAALAQSVRLFQSTGWDTELIAKGYPVTGKIKNIDGIQFFVNIYQLQLTSGETEGELDLSMLTKLTTLQMNANFCNVVKLPTSIETFNYNASTAAADEQRLQALDLSRCNNLKTSTLTNHRIGKFAFIAPENPTQNDISINVTGNPGVPFVVNSNFIAKLDASSKASFTSNLYKISDNNLGLKLSSALTGGVVVQQGGEYFIDLSKAPAVTSIDINQTAQSTNKITNIDCLTQFANLTSLDISGTNVSTLIDFSKFEYLKTLKMNSLLVNSVLLPASLENFEYNANPTATVEQKLSALDIVKCVNIASVSVENQNIASDAITVPLTPSKTNIIMVVTGNPGVPFPVPNTFYSKIAAANQPNFEQNSPVAGAFSLVWNPDGNTAGGASPWTYTSSTPKLSKIPISEAPTFNRASGLGGSMTQSDVFTLRISANYDAITTPELAVAADQYAYIQIINPATSTLNMKFTDIKTNCWRSNAGAQYVDVQYKKSTGSSFVKLQTITVPAGSSSASQDVTVNLSSIPALLPGETVELRFVPYAYPSAGGSCHIVSGQSGSNTKTFTINGETVNP